jgi:hypothetical protein
MSKDDPDIQYDEEIPEWIGPFVKYARECYASRKFPFPLDEGEPLHAVLHLIRDEDGQLGYDLKFIGNDVEDEEDQPSNRV